MKRNLLVTAISGDIANGTLKAFEPMRESMKIVGCDIYDYPCGLDKVDVFFKSVPYYRTEEYIRLILDKCEQYDITHIFPMNEGEIAIISKHRELFLERKIKLAINEQSVLDIFFDKYRTAMFLKENGLPYPETYIYDEYSGNLPFPVIVKDAFASGSKSVYIASNEEQLIQAVATCKKAVVQQYLPDENAEYTVGIFYRNRRHILIAFKRVLAQGGYTKQVNLVTIPRINTIADKIVSIIGKDTGRGFLNLQMREFKGEFYIFEVNPRISGTVFFRHQLGFSDPVWWLECLDNDEFFPRYSNPYTKAIGVRELAEKYLVLE